MRKVLLFITLIITTTALSQVGIGNEDPKATLDISANETNPDFNEGILIPRISAFPSTNPTSDQHGMLVFLNEEINEASGETFLPGFYYWNNDLSSWIKINTQGNKNFRVMETSELPSSINDNVYREGMTSLGEINSTAQLSTIVNNSSNNLTAKPRIALLVENNHPSTGASYHTFGIDVTNASAVNGNTYGIRTKNSTSTSNNKYGIHNQVTSTGSGVHYGIYTVTNQPAGSSSDMYGIQNIVGRTHGGSSINYGIHNEIGSTTSAGTIVGLYSKATGSTSATVYAGYFLGAVSIGTTNTDNYILPTTRGNEGEILVAEPNGNTSWQNASAQNFTTLDAPATSYQVTSAMSTIRINEQIDEIILPEASEITGKVFIILNATSSQATSLTVNNAGIVFNDTTSTNVTAIQPNSRLVVQSDGDTWYVIGN